MFITMILRKLKLSILSIVIFIFLSPSLNAQLKSENNQADYIIISPSQFSATLKPFVEWRQQKGLNVKIAELQSIYSEFPGYNKLKFDKRFHKLFFNLLE